MARENGSSVVGWISLIIAVIALILGWTAFSRSDQDVTDEINANVVQARQELEQDFALLEARTRLAALRSKIIAEENYNKTANDIADIRADLRASYADASLETRARLDEMDADLEKLENDLRSGSANAIDAFQRALESLERVIRND